MNAGLSNLATLKEHLLAKGLRSSQDFDARLLVLGQGVALALEKHCNRKFARVAGDTVTFSGDRDHFFLPRYPVESVASVEIKTSQGEGFATEADAIQNRQDDNGWIYFGAYLGDRWSVVRVTWTGGYFFSTAEPNVDDAQSLPAGATAMPADLLQAWLTQCQVIWTATDKLGTGIAKAGGDSQFVTGTLPGIDLAPLVKSMLRPFIRYQLT